MITALSCVVIVWIQGRSPGRSRVLTGNCSLLPPHLGEAIVRSPTGIFLYPRLRSIKSSVMACGFMTVVIELFGGLVNNDLHAAALKGHCVSVTYLFAPGGCLGPLLFSTIRRFFYRGRPSSNTLTPDVATEPILHGGHPELTRMNLIAAAAALRCRLQTMRDVADDAVPKSSHDYSKNISGPIRQRRSSVTIVCWRLTDSLLKRRAKDLATQKEFREQAYAIDGTQLTGANNIDFRILKETVDYEISGPKTKVPSGILWFTCEPGHSLFFGRAGFRAGGKTTRFAERNGNIPGCHRTSESSAASPRIHTRNGDRADAGCNQSRRTEPRSSTRSGAAMKKVASPVAGKTAAALEHYKKCSRNDLPPAPMATSFSARRVQEETALRLASICNGRNS